MRRIRRTTIAGVALLALIAAVVSFRHMHELCLRHGEDHLAAVLIPLAVDGLIVVASMSILLANRCGSRGGILAWSLLAVGSLASLGANVAVADPALASSPTTIAGGGRRSRPEMVERPTCTSLLLISVLLPFDVGRPDA
ncbi:DUF2637 domain-containing protein [Microbispora hainanensis]|uniref:DUF2637 domain-containing protein n=1 Tax=Microbispora hainanensis TaxID=568844 RepID=UPI0033CEC4DA